MIKKSLREIRAFVYASIFIVSSYSTVAAAVTTHQEDINQEKDYPIVIRPTSVLPGAIPKNKIPKDVKYAVKGSVYVVSVNLKSLRRIVEGKQKVKFWLGEDLGFIVAEMSKSATSGVPDVTSWTGNPKNFNGYVGFSIGKTGSFSGNITMGFRHFRALQTKEMEYGLIWEIDPIYDTLYPKKDDDPEREDIQQKLSGGNRENR